MGELENDGPIGTAGKCITLKMTDPGIFQNE